MTYHLNGCALNSRKSQKIIYSFFYGYALTICKLYTNNYEDAVKMMNDSFLKIFKEIHVFNLPFAEVAVFFKCRLRKIIVYTAIDRFRENSKYRIVSDVDDEMYHQQSPAEGIKPTNKEIISAIQGLPPAYQVVFNLFVIEGFSHAEISEQLGILSTTSRSHLSKARNQLKEILSRQSNFCLEIVT
jgi:RNA polymerase sigma factor (sigma-70 family)